MLHIFKKLGIVLIIMVIGFSIITCDDGGNDIGNGNGNGNGNNNGNGNDNGNGNGNNNGNSVAGKLYAKAPPILTSDTNINLSNVSGATIVEQSINYINANSGTYTLVMNSDVTLTGEYFLEMGDPPIRHLKTSNINFTIIGDNESRKITLSGTGRMFTVGESGKNNISLTLGSNIVLDGLGNGYQMIFVQDNATFTMKDNSKLSGSILAGAWVTGGSNFNLQNNAAVTGNGTYAIAVLNDSNIIMQDDSSISSNSGYGIIVRDALAGSEGNPSTFIMKNNAIISGNSSRGVLVVGSTFTMQDHASVSNNSGGVIIDQSEFIMKDNSIISGNITSTGGNGAGVFVESGTFTMQGNASITNNRTSGVSYGGGVVVKGWTYGGNTHLGYFYMEGGTISGNRAGTTSSSQPGMGGGVYVDSYGTFIMSGGTVYGSDASETLMNSAWAGVALSLSSSTSGPQIAKYSDDTNILPHGQGSNQYRTDNTITGR